MARAKRVEEEFNPWPPFVDVFSSVILVLLLFILVTIVNIAYYMQFNSKTESESTMKSQVNNITRGVDVTDMVTLKKVSKPIVVKGGNESLFSGGKAKGNAVVAAKDQTVASQTIFKEHRGEITVGFNSKEIFIDAKTQNEIVSFIKDIKKKHPAAKLEISLGNSTAIISTTIARQVSMARALNIKNLIKKENVSLSDMTLNVKAKSDPKYKNGYIKIKVIQ